jgi:hypothetical protein
MTKTENGWLVCGKGICLYAEGQRVRERCIKHGAILTFDWRLTGVRTRAEARERLERSTATSSPIEGEKHG